MFDKLRQIEDRYRELNGSLSDPAVLAQPALYAKTAKSAADLARMYTKYAERQKWKVELMDKHETGVGGFKEIVLFIQGRGQGRGAWSRLKFERGVHRVQRVPETESSGRTHTSTVTVAV